MPRGRRESYERFLSQENLDHRVVAFIYSLFSLSHLLSGGVSYTSGSLFLPFALNFRTGNIDQVDDDSPYGQSPSPLMDKRLSVDNKDVNSSDSPQNLPSLGWDDISVYNAKKELVKIISVTGTESLISFAEGKVCKVQSDILLPANPEILDGVDDLMQLSYLSEPSVLYNLQYRYDRDMIYSKAGPVLVVINPFKNIPLYGKDYADGYKRKKTGHPHVYAIADIAIREMIRDEVNQSIVISDKKPLKYLLR